jgi:hypothetical protein
VRKYRVRTVRKTRRKRREGVKREAWSVKREA